MYFLFIFIYASLDVILTSSKNAWLLWRYYLIIQWIRVFSRQWRTFSTPKLVTMYHHLYRLPSPRLLEYLIFYQGGQFRRELIVFKQKIVPLGRSRYEVHNSINRYEKIEAKESWKDLGIKKDEVTEGEIPILVDFKFVRSKTIHGHYEEVTFILSNYQIMLKLNNNGLLHFPLGKI